TVDPEPEHQQFARHAFRACGFASNRARFIPGRALDVLPRLADAGYDLVFCDGDRQEYSDYLAESLRLLRPGGLVVFEGVFANGRTVDSGPQPTEVLRLRELLRTVRESPELVPSLLPVGDGLLCAVKRWAGRTGPGARRGRAGPKSRPRHRVRCRGSREFGVACASADD